MGAGILLAVRHHLASLAWLDDRGAGWKPANRPQDAGAPYESWL